MAVFKCKMCGGTLEVVGGQTTAVCDYCGTQQTLPKLDDERKANLYNRANHFRRSNEFDKAISIYESILSEEGTDAEAYWSLVLCRYGIEYVEDPTTRKRVPTVNRAQFTSIFDDDNYKAALRHADALQRTIYEAEARTINEIQKGILAVSQKEDPFDVFICYKETDNNGRRTPDSVLANDLYHQLNQEGFKVFFSRITLEDKLGTAYEPYIFAALNSAKVMVVLGTKPEYFQAAWVKNEWSRYLALVKQSGGKRVLIPAYKDMDPYDLPEEFSHLQAQDMSKLGFMQDLIRGIKKLTHVDAPLPPVTAKETKEAVAAGGRTSVVPLLKRAFIYLEDGEWKSANEYCEKVLNLDPECAEAYVVKLMLELRCKRRELLREREMPFDNSSNYIKALRFGDYALKAELEDCIQHIKHRNEQAQLERIYRDAERMYAAASTDKAFLAAANRFKEARNYRDAREKVWECEQKAIEIVSDARYRMACESQRQGTAMTLLRAIGMFETIQNYRDSKERIQDCRNKYAVIMEARVAKAKKQKKVLIIVVITICALVALAALLNTVVIPQMRYDSAVDLMEQGVYEEANRIFLELGDYKDADTLADDCVESMIKTCLDDKSYTQLDLFLEGVDTQYVSIPSGYEDAFYQFAISVNEKDFVENESIWEITSLMEECVDLLTYLPETHAASNDVIAFYNLMVDACYGKDYKDVADYFRVNMDVFTALWDTELVRKVLQSDACSSFFLVGEWYAEDDSSKYLTFYTEVEESGIWCSYNLPWPELEYTHWAVRDMEFIFEDENGGILAQVYKFEFLDANTMKVYCYQDGSTYIMHRS